jgi:Cof subfamily protein (haloacid dehalogenase superfamily)
VKKVYVSDLDGTLLRDDAALSSFSRRILSEMLSAHLLFTVASARSATSIRRVLAGLELNLPVIAYNGSFITDFESGEHQIVNSVEPAIVEEIYDLIDASGCSPFVSTYDGAKDRIYYCNIANEGMRWYLDSHQGDKRLRLVKDVRQSHPGKVIRLTIIGQGEALQELESSIKARCKNAVETHYFENPDSPGWYWLTVHDEKATKNQAIRIVMREWNLEGSELVVFGDGDNDIRMLQMADRAIVVSNALDEVKRYATEVIGSNNEDSVAKFILKDQTGAT